MGAAGAGCGDGPRPEEPRQLQREDEEVWPPGPTERNRFGEPVPFLTTAPLTPFCFIFASTSVGFMLGFPCKSKATAPET